MLKDRPEAGRRPVKFSAIRYLRKSIEQRKCLRRYLPLLDLGAIFRALRFYTHKKEKGYLPLLSIVKQHAIQRGTDKF